MKFTYCALIHQKDNELIVAFPDFDSCMTFGKDIEDAKRMLREQSGQKQIVLSGYTYIGKGRELTRTVATEVYFNELS